MPWSSALFIAIVGLVLLYLIPHTTRTRQVMLESRMEDRFSTQLRVVAKADKASGKQVATPKSRGLTQSEERRGYVLTQTKPPEITMMRRPNVVADLMAAQNVAEAQRRRAQLARRAAAARRRLALVTLLFVATLAAGGALAFGALGIAYLITPAVLLVTTLGLGRRAVVLNARADARYARLSKARAEDLEAMRRGQANAEAETEVIPEVETAEEPVEEVAEVEAPAEPTVEKRVEETAPWTPVPVPAPAYTLKPNARRWEPAPLNLEEEDYSASAIQRDIQSFKDDVDEVETPVSASVAAEADTSAAGSDLDLDAILERRRAAGA